MRENESEREREREEGGKRNGEQKVTCMVCERRCKYQIKKIIICMQQSILELRLQNGIHFIQSIINLAYCVSLCVCACFVQVFIFEMVFLASVIKKGGNNGKMLFLVACSVLHFPKQNDWF